MLFSDYPSPFLILRVAVQRPTTENLLHEENISQLIVITCLLDNVLLISFVPAPQSQEVIEPSDQARETKNERGNSQHLTSGELLHETRYLRGKGVCFLYFAECETIFQSFRRPTLFCFAL